MLSRLAFKHGVIALRGAPKIQPAVAAFHTNTKDITRTQDLIDHWKGCNERYFGAQRDTVNFPHPEFKKWLPPTEGAGQVPKRLGIFPVEPFEALYSKTGVSGPYFAMFGLGTYVFSKEIFIIDHEWFDVCCFVPLMYILVKYVGPKATAWLLKERERANTEIFYGPLEETRSCFSEAVGKIDTEIAQEERHKYMYAVQRENLDLQLEARFRERAAEVHSAVKRRLDYQVELINTKKRFEQDHMVNWIVNNVVKGITPKQEKDAISSCIANLKSLAKTA